MNNEPMDAIFYFAPTMEEYKRKIDNQEILARTIVFVENVQQIYKNGKMYPDLSGIKTAINNAKNESYQQSLDVINSLLNELRDEYTADLNTARDNIRNYQQEMQNIKNKLDSLTDDEGHIKVTEVEGLYDVIARWWTNKDGDSRFTTIEQRLSAQEGLIQTLGTNYDALNNQVIDYGNTVNLLNGTLNQYLKKADLSSAIETLIGEEWNVENSSFIQYLKKIDTNDDLVQSLSLRMKINGEDSSLSILNSRIDATNTAVSGLTTKVNDVEAIAMQFSAWQNGEEYTYLSGLKTKANNGEALFDLTAAIINGLSTEAKASIVGLVKDGKSSLELSADDIIFNGTTWANEFYVKQLHSYSGTGVDKDGFHVTIDNGTIRGYKRTTVDGTSTNTDIYKFNNDGSGQLATGYITWGTELVNGQEKAWLKINGDQVKFTYFRNGDEIIESLKTYVNTLITDNLSESGYLTSEDLVAYGFLNSSALQSNEWLLGQLGDLSTRISNIDLGNGITETTVRGWVDGEVQAYLEGTDFLTGSDLYGFVSHDELATALKFQVVDGEWELCEDQNGNIVRGHFGNNDDEEFFKDENNVVYNLVTENTEDKGKYVNGDTKLTPVTVTVGDMKAALEKLNTYFISAIDQNGNEYKGQFFKDTTNGEYFKDEDGTIYTLVTDEDSQNYGKYVNGDKILSKRLGLASSTDIKSQVKNYVDDTVALSSIKTWAQNIMGEATSAGFSLSALIKKLGNTTNSIDISGIVNELSSEITISADKITLDGTTFADTIFADLINTNTLHSYSGDSVDGDGFHVVINEGTIEGYNRTTADNISTDSTLYKFNNDGSGNIANNNITWDSDGKLSIKNLVIDNKTSTAGSDLNLVEIYSWYSIPVDYLEHTTIPGQGTPAPGTDVRKDVIGYRIYRNGFLIKDDFINIQYENIDHFQNTKYPTYPEEQYDKYVIPTGSSSYLAYSIQQINEESILDFYKDESQFNVELFNAIFKDKNEQYLFANDDVIYFNLPSQIVRYNGTRFNVSSTRIKEQYSGSIAHKVLFSHHVFALVANTIDDENSSEDNHDYIVNLLKELLSEVYENQVDISAIAETAYQTYFHYTDSIESIRDLLVRWAELGDYDLLTEVEKNQIELYMQHAVNLSANVFELKAIVDGEYTLLGTNSDSISSGNTIQITQEQKSDYINKIQTNTYDRGEFLSISEPTLHFRGRDGEPGIMDVPFREGIYGLLSYNLYNDSTNPNVPGDGLPEASPNTIDLKTKPGLHLTWSQFVS